MYSIRLGDSKKIDHFQSVTFINIQGLVNEEVHDAAKRKKTKGHLIAQQPSLNTIIIRQAEEATIVPMMAVRRAATAENRSVCLGGRKKGP